jgi:hypothetical protein
MEKDIKCYVKQSFAQHQQQQGSDSDSSSDESADESNQSYVQYATVRNAVKPTSGKGKHGKGKHQNGVQFTQLQPIFEPSIAKLLQHPKGKAVKLDLREVLLLDNQSTVDLSDVQPQPSETDLPLQQAYAPQEQRWNHGHYKKGGDFRISRARVVQQARHRQHSLFEQRDQTVSCHR